MKSKIRELSIRALIGLALLVPVAGSLVACNTTAGAGKDVSAAGNAVSNAANSAKSGL